MAATIPVHTFSKKITCHLQVGVHDLQVCADAEVYAESLGEYMEEIARYAALSSSSSGGGGSGSSSRRQTKVMWLSMARVDESQVTGWRWYSVSMYMEYQVAVHRRWYWEYRVAVLRHWYWECYRGAVHGHVLGVVRGISMGTHTTGRTRGGAYSAAIGAQECEESRA